MIAYKVIFGLIDKKNREQAEDLIENYISVLFHNGQACGEYFLVVQDGKFCIYLNVQGIQANLIKYHCKYGVMWLERMITFFGYAPQWELIDDEVPQKDKIWDKSPFLYLFTHLNDWESPLYRGDNGQPIPIYLISGEHEQREEIYLWQQQYKTYDRAWMQCGALEIPAYKQLVVPSSELAKTGRRICEYVEKEVGIPTYYYLMRYWGRRKNEEARLCPSCGNGWNTRQDNVDVYGVCRFVFKCEGCRLVSDLAVAYDDERHAIIGEWSKMNKSQ